MKVQKVMTRISAVLLGASIIIYSIPMHVIAKGDVDITEHSVRDKLSIIPNIEHIDKTSNGTQKSDWVVEETNNEIRLRTYKGESTDIIIPSEIDGKQVFINGPGFTTKLSPEVTSVIFLSENGKKVKIKGGLISFFYRYDKLKKVDMSGLDLSNITSFNDLFGYCSSLTEIKGLNNIDTSNIDNIRFMFQHCTSLKDISFLENWDITNIKEFDGLFIGCESLEDITPLRNWDTSKVEDFSVMFEGCKSLHDITPLQNWNVANVTSMSYMFRGCSSLKYVDLSMWKPVNLNNAEGMFSEMGKIGDTLFVNLGQWNLENVSIGNIFLGVGESAYNVLVVTNDKKLENYNYKGRYMSGNRMNFNASGGIFADGSNWKEARPLYTIPDTSYSTVESIIENIKKEIDIPVKEGHRFNGWRSEAVYSNNVIALLNQTFNATWQPNIYNVNFNSQGGSNVMGQTIEYDKMIQEPIPPIKLGYTFHGWYKEKDYQTKWNFYTDRMPADNVTLYAKWILNTVELNHIPTINAVDKILSVGDKFNPLDGVTAYDKEDGYITLTKANIIANNVDMNQAGTYYITYKVTDSKGASIVKTITVTVNEKATKPEEKPENTPIEKPSQDGSDSTPTEKPSQDGKDNTPTIKPDKSPQTGDVSNLALWGFMFIGSSGMLLSFKRRNRKNNKLDV